MPFLMVMVLLSVSCRKEEYSTRPGITILKPQAMSIFRVTDTVQIEARVTHDKDIKQVSIVIRDQDNDAVTVQRYFFPGSSDYMLETDYAINAPLLFSGSYTLTVEATDGVMSTKEYLPIHLMGVEREFQRAIALCRPSQLKTYVYSIAENWEAQSIKTLDYGFLKAELNSHQHKLNVLKPQPSALMVYDLDELREDEYLSASAPFPVFNDLLTDGQLTYVASGNGNILGVNQYGQVQYVTPLMDTVPVLLQTHEDVVLAFSRSRGGPERFIMQYYKGTGSLKAWKKIGFDIISIFSADNEYCLLFAMEGDECHIYRYNVESNYLDESTNLPEGEIRDVVYTGYDDYLIAHSDGIFLYDYDAGNAVLWLVEKDIQNMAYDDLRSLLYCSTIYDIKVLRADNAGLVKQITLLFPIYDIMIQYNK